MGITAKEATSAISRLLKLELLREDGGGLVPQDSQTLVGMDTPSEAIKESHRQVLGLAEKAIFEKSIDEREIGSFFVSLKKEDFPVIRKEVKDALFTVLSKYASAKDRDAVYALSFQLFEVGDAKAGSSPEEK